jgi:hypothetical protein
MKKANHRLGRDNDRDHGLGRGTGTHRRVPASKHRRNFAGLRVSDRCACLGLRSTTPASWRRPCYVLHAYDQYGVKVRVLADAQVYDAGPRIIHGQTDEATKR